MKWRATVCNTKSRRGVKHQHCLLRSYWWSTPWPNIKALSQPGSQLLRQQIGSTTIQDVQQKGCFNSAQLQQRNILFNSCLKLFMYVCMHVCMYVRTYVRMHACMYVWMDGRMVAWMHGCMDACMDACMHARVYIYIYIHICVHICGFVWTRTSAGWSPFSPLTLFRQVVYPTLVDICHWISLFYPHFIPIIDVYTIMRLGDSK